MDEAYDVFARAAERGALRTVLGEPPRDTMSVRTDERT
ncbi:hypothetical protein SCOCK_370005 [Actinacidiphila cocklensis]|jgi:hypothetical protein|uniref:Uncharacterized protein n=1 Tax=Actinacidiphila cocklensis TaxID=887465 RepID=A0A9W4DTS9_9ACTN|nr:hypothetical protein SCOCK_370005 [Actinacidiphila cocklensis]